MTTGPNRFGFKPVDEMTNADARRAFGEIETRVFDELSDEEKQFASEISARITKTMRDQTTPESRVQTILDRSARR